MIIAKLLAIGLFFSFSLGISRANLGETEAQCIARYGPEFDLQNKLGYDTIGDKAASFQVKTPKGSFVIKVIFLNGIDSHEALSNADDSRGLTEDQIKGILDSDGAGLKWSKGKTTYHTDRADETSGTEDWLRSDGATARFWMSGKASSGEITGEVELSSRDYAFAQRDLDKRDGAN